MTKFGRKTENYTEDNKYVKDFRSNELNNISDSIGVTELDKREKVDFRWSNFKKFKIAGKL